jgi:hypothetical protein
MAPIFEAQLLHYLKLSGKKVELLINFKVFNLRDGIKTHGQPPLRTQRERIRIQPQRTLRNAEVEDEVL